MAKEVSIKFLKTWFPFLALFGLLVFGASYYVGFRLTTGLPVWGAVWVWSLLGSSALCLWLAPILFINRSRVETQKEPLWLTFLSEVSFVFMTFIFLLFVLLIIGDFVGLFVDLGLYFPWFIFVVAVALSVLGAFTAYMGPKVRYVFVPIRGLNKALQGLRIAQISDLHISTNIREKYVKQVVERVNELKPDLIALTGDIVDGPYSVLQRDVEILSELRAPLGVFYVNGNHEYYWNEPLWTEKFKSIGFNVLKNEHRLVEKVSAQGSGKILVVGVPDVFGQKFSASDKIDPEKAMRGAPARDFVLYLVHQPQAFKYGEDIGCDLQLSGHTHAGQFFPASLLIYFFHRYAKGLHRHKDLFWVYVNSGTGYWGPANRLGVPAEITLLELQPD